eukprot:gene7705-9912_t
MKYQTFLRRSCLSGISDTSSYEGQCPYLVLDNLGLLVASRESDKWSASFFKFFTDTVRTANFISERFNPSVMYCFNGQVELSRTNKLNTYKLILNANIPFHRLSSSVFSEQEAFYVEHGIERNVSAFFDSIKILVLNRPYSRRVHGLNGFELKFREKTEFPVKIQEFDGLDGLTLKDQIALFNVADVVISPHGAANSNWIFMRRNTLVIEIFPFGFQPPQYESLARVLGLNYDYAIASPDTTTFKTCVENSTLPSTSTERVLHRWMHAIKGADERLKSSINDIITDVDPHELARSRICARDQQLHVNVTIIFDIVCKFIEHQNKAKANNNNNCLQSKRAPSLRQTL